MTAKLFTLTNTGATSGTIDTFTFNDPASIGHTANLANLGGGSAVTGNVTGLGYTLGISASQSFTVDYNDTGAGVGTYSGNIVIGGSGATTQTINSTITVAGYAYVSEYGGELDAAAGSGNPAGASVKVTITGGFTGTILAGVGSFAPDYTPQKWIDPTSAASGVYAGLYVRATGTYSLNVTGSVSSAELYGPGVTPVVQNVPGTASGSVTSSWVLLSTAAADPDGWVVAAQASSSGATAGGSWNMTVEIATDSGGTNVVASALFLFFGIGSSN
jgi:hypothetical protein